MTVDSCERLSWKALGQYILPCGLVPRRSAPGTELGNLHQNTSPGEYGLVTEYWPSGVTSIDRFTPSTALTSQRVIGSGGEGGCAAGGFVSGAQAKQNSARVAGATPARCDALQSYLPPQSPVSHCAMSLSLS